MLSLFAVHKPKVGLVDQSRRLQSLAWLLLGQLFWQPAELRNSSYTSGRSCSAADESPCSMVHRMRVTSVMTWLQARESTPDDSRSVTQPPRAVTSVTDHTLDKESHAECKDKGMEGNFSAALSGQVLRGCDKRTRV